MTRALLLAGIVLALAGLHSVRAQDRSPSAALPVLAPTSHEPLPSDRSQFWIVPNAGTVPTVAEGRLARGAKLIDDEDFAAGLTLVRSADLRGTPLAGYAQYYTGLALKGLDRLNEAEAALIAGRSIAGAGALDEVVPIELAEIESDRNRPEAAADLLDELSRTKLSAPQDVLLRLGIAAERASEKERALTAYRRVYYDYPLSSAAEDAQRAIVRLTFAAGVTPDLVTRELARADRLFAARRWSDARAAFAPLAIAVAGADRARVELRMAECDVSLGRHQAAREALRSYATTVGPFQAEARFFFATATRALGNREEYVALARTLVVEHPGTEWAEEALNNLASHYIQVDQDDDANQVFRELYLRYPQGRFAERAAWKTGWWSYRKGDFTQASRTFEQAAGSFPRADTRPAWLYWSGRSRDQAGDAASANTLYRLVVADYQNSYYGRLASKLLLARREVMPLPVVTLTGSPAPKRVPNEALIRSLGGAGLYDDALREVRYAQQVWGDSTVLQATTAWLRHQQGLTLKANERFAGLRGAITQMRRSYPQFMASGGERLPPDVLRVIFPLDFWPLIKSYSDKHGLDPYLIAALMAQESTFTAEIRSSANAYGLMQIIPSTGRRYARILGVRPFSTASLTNPEVNVRIGTQFFKDLIDQFGGAHFALAGYNAGPHRVTRWLQEAPGLTDDEFIENIPFPETQGYVKRILGTAEDYRRLYGPSGPLAPVPTAVPARAD